MATPLRTRADELRATGLTPLRTFWALRKEFPNAERDHLVMAAQLPGAPRGINPSWTEMGQTLTGVSCRRPPKAPK